MADTIFSKIIRKEIPATIIHEDELTLAFLDIAPRAPKHILVIPKKEMATANDMTEADKNLVGHMFFVATQIAKKQGIAEDGYRLVINCNKNSGQVVYHLHMHIVGGKKLGEFC